MTEYEVFKLRLWTHIARQLDAIRHKLDLGTTQPGSGHLSRELYALSAEAERMINEAERDAPITAESAG
jgi:hypothetical protein